MQTGQTIPPADTPTVQILKSIREANSRIGTINNRLGVSGNKMVDTSTPDKEPSQGVATHNNSLLPNISKELQLLHDQLDIYSSLVNKIESLF